MTTEELQEKIKLIRECQKVLYELHENLGTRFAKSCAEYMDYTLESLETPREQNARKEYAIGQKVQLTDAVYQANFVSQIHPKKIYEKGAIGWICNDGVMYCQGNLLHLDTEKVKVSGFDAEAVTECLWYFLTRGWIDTSCIEVDWDLFSERVEAMLWHLNLPVPKVTKQDLGEITFEDLSKHQFWQHRQDFFRLEDE